MRKFFYLCVCVAALLLTSGCGKENGKNDEKGGLTKMSWAELVKEHSFLEGFPVFDGEVENYLYKDLGGGLLTVTFFDYGCEESVATSYYAKFDADGYKKSEGSNIYRKTKDGYDYTFTGSYANENFALSFSVEPR